MRHETSSPGGEPVHEFACMEIAGGIEAFEGNFRTPCMDFWISTKPFRNEATGGDVHYVSLCGGGITTRLLLADVSGHGSHVRQYAEELRRLVKRFINAKKQGAFMDAMNRGFTEYAAMNRFATVVAATWLGPARSMELSIAGHPRPLLYRNRSRTWQILGEGPQVQAESLGSSDLPIGIDDETAYATFETQLDPDDLLIFYTDSLTEARSPAGKFLGESGLLDLVQQALAEHERPEAIGQKLLSLVAGFRGGEPPEDDETLIVALTRPFVSKSFDPGERLRVIGKVLRVLDY